MDDRLTVERKAVPWPVGNDKLTVDEFGGFVEERLEPVDRLDRAAPDFAAADGKRVLGEEVR